MAKIKTTTNAVHPNGNCSRFHYYLLYSKYCAQIKSHIQSSYNLHEDQKKKEATVSFLNWVDHLYFSFLSCGTWLKQTTLIKEKTCGQHLEWPKC